MTVSPKGRPCPSCGQRGCLEAYASVYVLKEKLVCAGVADTELDDLEALFSAGNPVVMEWIDEAAVHLAPMVAMLENILDPQTVILGGALPENIISEIIARMGHLPTSVASRMGKESCRASSTASPDS